MHFLGQWGTFCLGLFQFSLASGYRGPMPAADLISSGHFVPSEIAETFGLDKRTCFFRLLVHFPLTFSSASGFMVFDSVASPALLPT